MATSKLISKLDDLLQLKLGKIIETEDFFIAKIDDRGNMSRSFNKYTIALHYANKTGGCFFRCKQECFFFSFTTAICTPVDITIASINLVFLVNNSIVKIFLKTMRRKKEI